MSKTQDNSPETAPQAVEEKGASINPPAGKAPPRKGGGKGVWVGTAAGIGSAAIVAALLYANKKRT
ncbi:hypothetical protein FHS51_000982 [Sphingobium wenxiniae]|uniref:Uncharacterized protein n=2 Tax=Sphingobium TaxID=165695 RepID=T0GQW1_9SPHN|nr:MULTISPECIES: hypothetical protein [Sphingobium]EQB06286.1 hypothetical protein L485_01295 [Sphingobium baderi LL03]KMS62429.1 hypothetical protein V475_06780 [Sphingobium baderi LL03]MBB6190765.1 hypothetical protein [Sphingobium wenxiniae]TWH94543.1 hypothetical protein IQ35_01786 [Sphingobium wenxiniae]WRD76806.1 hypothetical protein QQ987_01265 [Sphingobium baderi]